MKKRIFIVDDYPLMRRGYAALIDRETDLMVCGDAGTAADTIAAISTSVPDLLISDISLGGKSGRELLSQIRQSFPQLPVLLISMHDEPWYIGRAIALGARGYLMKSESTTKLITAIRSVLAGEFWASEQIAFMEMRHRA